MVLLSQNAAILDKLLAAQTFTAQSDALRALKNDTVGHVMKKEKWVELGVLRPIVRVLLPERPPNWQSVADGRGNGNRQDSPGTARNRQPSSVSPPDNLAADNLAHLQALELLGIFASGGPPFLAPLNAAGALPAILDYVDPDANHPRLVYAALRTLATLIKTARLVSVSPLHPSPVTLASLADTILAPARLHVFHHIILAAPRAWWTESITNTAIAIISSLCSTDVRHQTALAKAAILDALAVKIASYVVLRGQVVPGADLAADKEGLRDAIPGPATHLLDVAGVFDAVAAILGDSRLRACMLLSAPSILAIFPQLEFESPSSDVNAAWRALSAGGLGGLDQGAMGALDYLLPAIPTLQPRALYASTTASASRDRYSSMGGIFARKRAAFAHQQRQLLQQSRGIAAGAAAPAPLSPAVGVPGVGSSAAFADGKGDKGEDAESPMVPWLVDLVRSSTGLERLMAASVLTSIYKAGFAAKPSRESAMAVLIIPLLLRMIETSGKSSGPASREPDDEKAQATQQTITEVAITVLARLVANNDTLQKAAVDGKAIKILAKLLKESYEPVSVRASPRPWNPTPVASANPTRTGTPVGATQQSAGSGAVRAGQAKDEEDKMQDGPVEDEGGSGYSYDHPCMLQVSSVLGPAGQSTLLAYRIRLREAVLKALTALLATKYDYQKAFVEQDVMMYLVASLNATPSKPRNNPSDSGGSDKMSLSDENESRHDTKLDPEYGRNPVGVLVAGCNCVRMLSRSIALLRTTLQDAGVSAPIYRLVKHPDIDVQIAATAVVCNLVTETSPMRERYVKAGIMDELCTHAHSQHSALRLNALWALKHLVDGVAPSVKKACLEQLGSGWLLQLIDCDSEGDSAATSFYGRTDSFRSTPSVSFAPQPSAVDDRMDEDVEMGHSENNDYDYDDDVDGEDHERSREHLLDSGAAGKMPWTAAHAVPAPVGSPAFQRARFPQTSHERSRTGRLRQAEAKIAALRELELNVQRKNQHDDILIQEQGLDFIRNLIGPGFCTARQPSLSTRAHASEPASQASSTASSSLGGTPAPASAAPAASATAGAAGASGAAGAAGASGASGASGAAGVVTDAAPSFNSSVLERTSEATEMIDYLFNEFGQDRFFSMLLSKVRPRPRTTRHSARLTSRPSSTSVSSASSVLADTRAGGSGGDTPRMQQPRAKVVEAVVYILVHIAAGVVRHRQIVVAQTELMRTLMNHFASRERGVRVALCHLVANLTWYGGAADTLAAHQRGVELRKLGAAAHLERLRVDPELDVREHAKMAAHQMGLDDTSKEPVGRL